MATLYVTEYSEVPAVRQVPMPVAMEPAVVNQTVSFTTSTASSAFGADTKYVRIVSDTDCHLLFGTNPTATTSHQKLLAGQEAWRGLTAVSLKVAAVTAS